MTPSQRAVVAHELARLDGRAGVRWLPVEHSAVAELTGLSLADLLGLGLTGVVMVDRLNAQGSYSPVPATSRSG